MSNYLKIKLLVSRNLYPKPQPFQRRTKIQLICGHALNTRNCISYSIHWFTIHVWHISLIQNPIVYKCHFKIIWHKKGMVQKSFWKSIFNERRVICQITVSWKTACKLETPETILLEAYFHWNLAFNILIEAPPIPKLNWNEKIWFSFFVGWDVELSTWLISARLL